MSISAVSRPDREAPEPHDGAVTRNRPMRADARRNREAVLRAASEALFAHGSEASLDEIARNAGVGIGTLYRHFPTRQDLLEAVFISSAENLRSLAADLLDAAEPMPALVEWLRAQMAMGRQGRSIGSAVLAAKHETGTDINLACTSMHAGGAALLARAQAAGVADPDVTISDVLGMVHGIVLVTEGRDDGIVKADRMFDLVCAGLRSH